MTDEVNIVVVDAAPETVDVVLTNTEIVEVNTGAVGPQGIRGLDGAPGAPGGLELNEVSNTVQQGVPAATWLINHQLPYPPTVTIVDSANSVVEGSVQYVSATQIEVSFAVPFSGTAYLS